MSFKRVINLNLIPKKGQVTIFIIIAIFILAAVAAFLIYRNSVPIISQIPSEFQPAYNTFLSCIEDNTQTGINILESQGGYITLPNFESGSSFMPFSSQLDFMGNPIPYWYYVSGNNVAKEQVPTQIDMENQIAQFIDERIRNCDFSSYTNTDFQIQMGEPTAKVSISQNKVSISLNMDLSMNKGNESAFVRNHKADVNSELGNLYTSAKTVYDYEQKSLFLENYTIDVLRNYAPVDGVEISCSPLTWNANDVVANLSSAIENNIDSLHSGNNATDYFSIKIPVQGVGFLTSPSWAHDFEINPTEDSLMIAQPIGNQAGLGILGFCYIPYHFVYNIKYPVLVTVSSNGETFQFPLAVVVQGNNPRVSLNGTSISTTTPVLCQNENTPIAVNVFDSDSNPVNADISFECIGEKCDIGQTNSGVLNGKFPQCVGGYIVANADGFATGRYPFTTTQSGSLNIVLNKIYNEPINLKVDGNAYNGNAVINFISSDGKSQTAVYPQQKTIGLSEGFYTVQVYIYQNSSIKIGATTKQQCVNVQSGIPGALGIPQQQCFNINIPEQVISNALAGGGKADYPLTESQLKNSNMITIDVPSLPKPDSVEQIQQNYLLFDTNSLSINLA
jgi:hypothetical protein